MAQIRDSFSWVSGKDFEERHLKETRDFRKRYDGMELVGIPQWKALAERVVGLPDYESLPSGIVKAFEGLVEVPKAAKPRDRLFISHRRDDLEQARKIAAIAVACGYSYWLDVEDPILAGLGPMPQPATKVYAILVAATIEMALLNSTHLIAVVTPEAFPPPPEGDEVSQKGPSLWIPYEFGRAKARKMFSRQVAWWRSRSHAIHPEYLHLGLEHNTDDEIASWLGGPRFDSSNPYDGSSSPYDPIIANPPDLP